MVSTKSSLMPPRINRALTSESSGDSSDDSHDIFIGFRTNQNPAPIPVGEPERPTLCCSARLNKGQHYFVLLHFYLHEDIASKSRGECDKVTLVHFYSFISKYFISV